MIRILHVLGSLNRAGAETWLVHVLKHIDRSRFQMDFLVHSNGPDDYDAVVQRLGARVIRCPHPQRVWSYTRNLKRLLRSNGPYDLIHSHVHKFSGIVLWVAARAGVPVRLAHSHLDTAVWDTRSHALRGLYDRLMKRWINTYATGGYGASRDAAKALFGDNWSSDAKWKVLFYGIDLLPFRNRADGSAIRTSLGLSKDAFVIGHVGRFSAQKNHEFIVRIGVEAVKKESRAHLLLLGDGPLRTVVEDSFREHGIRDHVTFAGVRQDVPDVMASVMDVFLFPSLTEGLPLALLEAQAAGLPCVISSVIAKETDAVPHLIRRRSLTDPALVWAEEVLRLAQDSKIPSRSDAFEMIEGSPFNILRSVRSLEAQYLESTSKHPHSKYRQGSIYAGKTE